MTMEQRAVTAAIIAAILSLHVASCASPEGQDDLSKGVAEAGLGAVAEFDCAKVSDPKRACLKKLQVTDDTNRVKMKAELFFVVEGDDGKMSSVKVFELSSEQQDTAAVVDKRTDQVISIAEANRLLGTARWEAVSEIAGRLFEAITILAPNGAPVSSLAEWRALRQRGAGEPTGPSLPVVPAPAAPVIDQELPG